MKIAFVLDDGLDTTDGVQQYVLTLGNWLTSHGHTVHYLVGQTKRTDISGVHSLSKNIRVRFNQNRLTIPLGATKRRLKKLLDTEKYELLHVQIPYSPQFAAKIIKAAPRGTAIVGTFHILPFSWVERSSSKLLAGALKGSLQQFDETISVSDAAREFALDSYGIDSQVLPNVVDVRKFRTNRKIRHAKKLQLVFLGRLVARKGAIELIRALALVSPETLSNIEVTIGGTGPLRKKLELEIIKLRLSHVVQLAGFVLEEQKPDFLGKADIAVFPALGGESFGIVLLEAMAAGAGVVMGGDNPGYKTVLGKWPETIVTSDRPAVFANQLEQIINDKLLRQRIHDQQQRAVEGYDVPRVGQQIVKIYNHAIDKHLSSAHT